MTSVAQRITDTGTYYRLRTGGEELGPYSTADESNTSFDADLAQKLGVEPKDILEARLFEVTRPTTFHEIADVLDVTVRHDLANKLIVLNAGILAATEEDQINILMSGESSGGKSYTAIEGISYFPEDMLLVMATASPRAFYHETGMWDPDRRQLVVNLEKKLLVFLDQPHPMLMEALRPLLSHDRKQLVYKITDKNRSGALRTKTVCIVGFPSTIFCAARIALDEQERTRLFMLSPETSQEKMQEAIQLKIRREADRELFRAWVNEHPRRRWLKARIQALRDSGITQVILPDQEEICKRFMQSRPYLAPRHQRDISRILAMIKAHALLNWANREQREHGTILATQEDVEAGFGLYGLVAAANELGLSPALYQIWTTDLSPLLSQQPGGVSRGQILSAYHKRTGRYMADAKLRREILPAIEAAGLIVQASNPLDRREKLIMRPTEEDVHPPVLSPISPPEKIGDATRGYTTPLGSPPAPSPVSQAKETAVHGSNSTR